jgi:hypothetical protein
MRPSEQWSITLGWPHTERPLLPALTLGAAGGRGVISVLKSKLLNKYRCATKGNKFHANV